MRASRRGALARTLIAIAIGATASTASAQVTFLFGLSHWSDLRQLRIPDATPGAVELRDFSPGGWNLEMGFYRTRELAGERALSLGGEFGIFWHGSAFEDHLTNGNTGERETRRVHASAGHLTGSVRYRLGRRHRLDPYVGGGAGLYLLRMKESWSGTTVDLRHHDAAPGGYLAAGFDIGGPGGRGRVRVEAKVHLFSFGGDTLAGREVGGPLIGVAAGGAF